MIPIYTYIYIKKLSRQISCGFKILDKLGVRIKKIKITLLVGFFENQSKSRLFIKDFPFKIEGENFLEGFPLKISIEGENFLKEFPLKISRQF